MRVGYVQIDALFGEVKANIENVAGRLRGLSADLIVLPELFSSGY